MKELEAWDCERINSFDLSGCASLERFWCWGCVPLTSLDLSDCVNLKELQVYDELLEQVVVNSNKDLEVCIFPYYGYAATIIGNEDNAPEYEQFDEDLSLDITPEIRSAKVLLRKDEESGPFQTILVKRAQ